MDNWDQGTFTLSVSRLYRCAISLPDQIERTRLAGAYCHATSLLGGCIYLRACTSSSAARAQRDVVQSWRYPCRCTVVNTSPLNPTRERSAVRICTVMASFDSAMD